MTKIPKKPRYRRSTAFAMKALAGKNIRKFPVDVKIVCKAFGIKLKKYSTLAKKNNVTIDEIGEAYRTKLGYIYRNADGKYFISYNDTLPIGLIRFTLAHELGHFFLNHLEDFDETELMYNSLIPYSTEHQTLEREANCFARNFLSPSPIAKLVGNAPLSLQYLFGITYSASLVRIESLQIDEKNLTFESNKNFYSVFNHLKLISFMYKNLYLCNSCSSTFSVESAHNCVYCGKFSIEKIPLEHYSLFKDFERTEIMEYSKIETNEKGTPLECPKCQSKNLKDGFNYCPYCAAFIHNVCLGSEDNSWYVDYKGDNVKKPILELSYDGCGGYLDGGFRFCPDCGNETSFSAQKFLKPAEQEKAEHDLFN